MRVVFIFKLTDNILLIRSLYEVAFWLRKSKDIEFIFYVPAFIEFNVFNKNEENIRYLNEKCTANDIPEADIIISSNLKLLDKLSNLGRGELVYLNLDNSISRFNQLNLSQVGIGIPTSFFVHEKKRKNKIIIGGNKIEKEEIEKIFAVIKASISFSIDEIIIISSNKLSINTGLDYRFFSEGEIRYKELFSESFFLIWLDKEDIIPPIIPLWAMASELIVLGINSAESIYKYPVEINGLDSLELALQLIKIYKMGQYRSKILYRSREITKKNKLDIVGEKWYGFLQGVLNNYSWINKMIEKNTVNIEEDYLVDLIIENESNLEQIKNCLEKVEKHTNLSHHLIIISNSSKAKNLEFLRRSGYKIRVIERQERRDWISALNQGIVSGRGSYIVILKDYIEVSEGWLEPLIKKAKEENTAVVIPSIINDEREKVENTVTVLNNSNSKEYIKEITGLNRDCYLIKREFLSIIGLIDEYFQELKELDYYFRAVEKGYKIVYCNDSELIDTRTGEPVDGINDDIRDDMINHKQVTKFEKKWTELINGNEKRRETEKIIIFGLKSWNFKLQRIHDLAYSFSKMGYQVLYINPVCGNNKYLQIDDNLFVYSPAGTGTVLYNIREGRELLVGRGIREIARELGFINCMLIINNPSFLPLLKYLEYSLLIYDSFENYRKYIISDFQMDFLQESELDLLNVADFVLVNSEKLYKKFQEINENTYILKDTCDNISLQNWVLGIDKLLNLFNLAYHNNNYLYENEDHNLVNTISEGTENHEDLALKISNIKDYGENYEELDISAKEKKSWLKRLKRFFTG